MRKFVYEALSFFRESIYRSKHQPIDIKTISTLVEPRLHALR
jgi:hypothetical protein